MNDGSSAFIAGGLVLIAAGGIALGFQRLLSPSPATGKSALYFARVWFSWAVFVVVLVTLPEVFKSFSADSILRLLIGCIGYGALAFALGYAWGQLFAKGSSQKRETEQGANKHTSTSQRSPTETLKPPQPETERIETKAERQAPTNDPIDENKLYVVANNHFNENRDDDGLRIKCMTIAGGDPEKARYLYIAERVKQLANNVVQSGAVQTSILPKPQPVTAQERVTQKTNKAKCYVCASEYGQNDAECPACHSTARIGDSDLENIARITCDMGLFYYCGLKFDDRDAARLHVKKLNQFSQQ